MQLRTSRLSLANVAIRCLLMLDSTSAKDFPRDITVASREGTALLSESDWNEEIKRFSAAATRSISKDGSIALFEASFDSVPNIAKLADWIAYKWAPTVLTTYDIAGIRKGARPVYATRVAVEDDGEEAVEIYWQELVNFQETRNVGKMIIRIKNYGIVASRKSLISETAVSESKPFPGENVLIRRLADAASQATEKGLAVKVCLLEFVLIPVQPRSG